MLYAGTSGYSFNEWIGEFYPPKTKSRDFLEHYAGRMNSVEINYTFRRFPRADRSENWNRQTPGGFRFAVKMHQKVTHRLHLKDAEETIRDFLAELEPLGAKLGVVLFQCSPFFKCDLDRLTTFVQSLPDDKRFAMEFRHDSWDTPEVEAILRGRSIARCVAELDISEPMTSELPVTAPYAYVRLRKAPPYSDDEIFNARSLLDALSKRVEDIFLYAKHDDQGLAPSYVRRITESRSNTPAES